MTRNIVKQKIFYFLKAAKSNTFERVVKRNLILVKAINSNIKTRENFDSFFLNSMCTLSMDFDSIESITGIPNYTELKQMI